MLHITQIVSLSKNKIKEKEKERVRSGYALMSAVMQLINAIIKSRGHFSCFVDDPFFILFYFCSTLIAGIYPV